MSTAAMPAMADDFEGPPFDFSDAFYLANGIDPATLIGRPTGTGPFSQGTGGAQSEERA